MKNWKVKFCFLFLCMVQQGLSGQTKLTLAKAIQIGLRNNFQIQIANSQLRLSEFNTDNANKDRMPTVNLNINQSTNLNESDSPISFVAEFYRDAGLNGTLDANWVVFDGFRNKANKSRLKELENASKTNVSLIIENTIQAIQLAYYNLIINKEILETITEVKQLSKEKLEDARLKEKFGKNSKFDVMRFENAYLIDSSQFIIQQNEYQLAEQKLNLALGNRTLKNYNAIDDINFSKQNYNCKKLLPKLIRNNNQLRNQMINIALKRKDQAIQNSLQLPTLSANLGGVKGWNRVKFKDVPAQKANDLNFYLRFTLSYTVFDGGVTNRSIQESKMEEKIEMLKFSDIEQTLKNELCQLVEKYNSQLNLIKINEKLITNLRQNLEMVNNQIKNGFSSSLEFRVIQLEYLNAQKTRLETINQLKSTEVMIAKLTGGLSPKN